MPMPLSLDLALELARRYCAERFPNAAAVLAGSIARGTATPASDIDLVLVFERLGNAWRETATINGIAVEIFAHDPETLAWFFDQGSRRRHRCAGRDAGRRRRRDPRPARCLLARRPWPRRRWRSVPRPLDARSVDKRRYIITDLAEDLRGGGTPGEIIAIAARLYQELGDLILRSAGHWSGTGKALARRLEQHEPALALRFEHAFGSLFRHGHAAQVLRPGRGIAGAARRSAPPAGYHNAAPASWRKKINFLNGFRVCAEFSRRPRLTSGAAIRICLALIGVEC